MINDARDDVFGCLVFTHLRRHMKPREGVNCRQFCNSSIALDELLHGASNNSSSYIVLKQGAENDCSSYIVIGNLQYLNKHITAACFKETNKDMLDLGQVANCFPRAAVSFRTNVFLLSRYFKQRNESAHSYQARAALLFSE
jgi:hypothetical protein